MNWYKFSQNVDYGLIMQIEQIADAGDIHKLRNLASVYTLNTQLYQRERQEKFLEKAKEAEKKLRSYIYRKKKRELV